MSSSRNPGNLSTKRMKSRRKPAIQEDTSNLPSEVIYTILSKLPVKSLFRFKCVSKPWRALISALISEPQFIKLHLNEAFKSGRQRVIGAVLKSECFFSVDFETFGKPEEQLYFPVKKYRKASVLCSCNGIVLLGVNSDKMYVLWNPSTREYKRFSCPYSGNISDAFYGICYDSSANDYKVIIIYSDQNNCNYFVVFTCRNNSWTKTRDFPYDFPYLMPHDGVNLSGDPHWVVALKAGYNSVSPLGLHTSEFRWEIHGAQGRCIRSSLTLTDNPSKSCETSVPININHDEAVPSYVQYRVPTMFAIVYFDLVEEKFMDVPLPNWLCGGEVFCLTVMRGHLCLSLVTSDFQKIDMWEMKEYGNRNSWTRSITIRSIVGSTNLYSLKPMCFTKRGEVVRMGDSTIVLYDPKTNKLRQKPSPTGTRYSSKVASYVDTLAFPIFDKRP